MFDPSQVRSTLGNADLKEDIEALYNRIPEIEIPEIDDIKKLFQGIKFTIYKDQWVKDEDYFKVILRHNLKLKLESIDIRFFNTKNESILLDFKYENDDTYLVLYSNVAEDIYIILKQKIESECSGGTGNIHVGEEEPEVKDGTLWISNIGGVVATPEGAFPGENLDKLLTENKTSLVDAINEVFQNVVNGKIIVATAINDLTGSKLSGNETFDEMSKVLNNLKEHHELVKADAQT